MICIALEHVTKQFRRGEPLALFDSEDDTALFDGEDEAGDDGGTAGMVLALDDISLRIARGERVGVLGPAGAGKSTLLGCIAGVIRPDTGRIGTSGQILNLQQFALPLRPSASGRDNLVLCAGLAGIARTAVDSQMDAIADFAGIGTALDAPASTYPRGLFARLGIAALLHLPADLRLIDDGLPRDGAFRSRCIARLLELADALLLVSPNLMLIEVLCTRAIRLQRGRLVADGPVRAVIQDLLQQDGGEAAPPPPGGPPKMPALRVQRPAPIEGQPEPVMLQHFACLAAGAAPGFKAELVVAETVRLRAQLEIFAASMLVAEVQHEAPAPLAGSETYLLSATLPPGLLAPQAFKARLQIEYARPDSDDWRFQSVAIPFLVEAAEAESGFRAQARPSDRKPAVKATADWTVKVASGHA